MKTAPWPLAAIVVFLVLAAINGARALHLDDADFAPAARQTAATGRPVFYHGEQRPRDGGLMHPPLYIYTLAAWIRLFGASPAAMRMLGAVCAVGLGWVTVLILRALFSSAQTRPWEPWFWLLYLFNPYTLQTSAIVDIDSSIYGPLLCLAVLIAVRMSWRDGAWRGDPVTWREVAALAATLVACEWAKLTTVWLTFPFVFLLLLRRVGGVRAAAATVALAAVSGAVFAATYALYGMAVRMDTAYTYQFAWMSFTHRGVSAAGGLTARLDDFERNADAMIPALFSWAGAMPWLASLAALGCALWSARRHPRLAHYGIVMALAIACTLGYCVKVQTFGAAPFKYVLVYWAVIMTGPVFLAAVAGLRPGWLFAAAYAAACAASYAVFRDRLILGGFHEWRHVRIVLAVAFVAACALRWRSAAGTALGLSAGLACGTLLWQVRAPYSTTYNYGQLGMEETAQYLRAHTGPDELIVAMKDLGYLTGRRFFENYPVLYLDQGRARFEQLVLSGEARYIVFTERKGEDQLFIAPAIERWVREHCVLVQSIGDYRIYQPREKAS